MSRTVRPASRAIWRAATSSSAQVRGRPLRRPRSVNVRPRPWPRALANASRRHQARRKPASGEVPSAGLPARPGGGGDHLVAAAGGDAEWPVALQVDADLAGAAQTDESVSLDVGQTEFDVAVGEPGLAGAAGDKRCPGRARTRHPLQQNAQCGRDGEALAATVRVADGVCATVILRGQARRLALQFSKSRGRALQIDQPDFRHGGARA